MNKGLRWLGSSIASNQNRYWTLMYILLLGGLVLSFFAFTRPLFRSSRDEIPYQQTGFITYAADVAADVYDNNRLESGDAIFPQLSCSVLFTFDYAVHTPDVFTGSGRYKLFAEVSETSGWHRRIDLQPETEFSGSSFHTEQELNVCNVMKLIEKVQAATGIQQTQYYLSIQPQVEIQGQTSNLPLTDTFSPELRFQVEQQQIFLPQQSQDSLNSLQPAQAGLLVKEGVVPNAIPVLQLELPVYYARWLSIAILVFSIAGLALPVFLVNHTGKGNERVCASLLTGMEVIEVQEDAFSNGPFVDLATLKDLSRLADLSRNAIFLQKKPSSISYMVYMDGITYRCCQSVDLSPEDLQ